MMNSEQDEKQKRQRQIFLCIITRYWQMSSHARRCFSIEFRRTQSPRSGRTVNMRWWRWRCKHSTLNFHENYSHFLLLTFNNIYIFRIFCNCVWLHNCSVSVNLQLSAFNWREKCVFARNVCCCCSFLFFFPRRWISFIAACVSFAQILAYIVGGGLRCHPNCVRSMVSSHSTHSIQRLQHSG